MARRLLGMTVAALTCMAVLGLGLATAGTNADDPPAIKDIMKKLNGKGQSESGKMKKALAAKKADWTAIKASAKEFAELGPKLAENDPPKGDKADWKTQAEAYGSETKALSEAAEKEDLAATKKSFGKISMSCAACHKMHKP